MTKYSISKMPDDLRNQNGSNSTANNSNPNRHNFSKIEFPKFTDTQCVEYWFLRLESWFRLQQISDETVQFESVVASLTPQLFDQVVDLVVSPPSEEPYKKLKKAIIEKFADSEYIRVDKLLSTVPLGSQRPSHLLAEIRRAGATRDEKIIRVCWLRRLPATIRAVLSASRAPLAELSDMADATFDTLQMDTIAEMTSSSSSAGPSCAAEPTSTTNKEIIQYIQSLSKEIGELKSTVNSIQQQRSRSQNRPENRQRSTSRSSSHQRDQSSGSNRLPTCWYHRNFGTQAQKCEKPCDFPSQPPSMSSS